MKISAWDLFNVLKEKTYEELKDINVVVETDRPSRRVFGKCEYATFVDEMEGQIRIGNVKE